MICQSTCKSPQYHSVAYIRY